MYPIGGEEGVGHCKPSWVDRRELGLLSECSMWVSTNLTPGIRE